MAETLDPLDALDQRCVRCGALVYDTRCRNCGQQTAPPHVERPRDGDDLPGVLG